MHLRSALPLAVLAGVSLLHSTPAAASPVAPEPRPAPGSVRTQLLVPDSTVPLWADTGVRAHTNHLVVVTATRSAGGFRPNYVGSAPGGETPQSIRGIYGLPSTGGSGVIAIVDAYDYGTALNDFNVFSRQFGLPAETSASATSATNKVFQVVYAGRNGRKPTANASWNQEAALDIEWAHAMAPNAKIVLVEAASASFSDLFSAVQTAGSVAGVREVSCSWGGSEFSGETSYDGYFAHSGVAYFASSGDTGGVMEYPAASPNVVSAGGTTVHRDASGAFTGETGWSGAGGGVSVYEPRPSYQNGISGIVGGARGVPDFSFDADPNSGVSVYDSTPYQGYSGWLVFGGTSVASPALAGIVNTAATARGSFANSSAAELGLVYGNLGNSAVFNDVVGGSAGSFTAVAGWDFVTGVGSDWGLNGK